MNFEGKKALVTGGAGFIGSHLTDELVRLKADVVVIDNLSTGKMANLEQVLEKISYVAADVRKPDTFRNLEKVDIIFHEAASALVPSFASPVDDLDTNAKGTLNLLEVARKSDARFVYASTGSVYGEPLNLPIREDHPLRPVSPYGVSKLSGEHYVCLYNSIYGMRTMSLRYFNVYGERQTISEEMGVIPIFVHRLLVGKNLTIFGDGLQTRDFTHVSDVVSANLLASEARDGFGSAVNIGSGKETSILELADLVTSLMGHENTRLIFKPAKPGDIRRLCSDINQATRLLEYHPRTNLKTGLQSYIKATQRVEAVARQVR